jgi:hypothetical protein
LEPAVDTTASESRAIHGDTGCQNLFRQN